MAKKNKVVVQAVPDTWLDDVARKAPALCERAASLAPFDDVITERWIDKDYVGIGIEAPTGVYPSGIYHTYGARIYADKVIMSCYSDYARWSGKNPGPAREEYLTDMPRLWSFLRQLPRPMHSFGEWHSLEDSDG